MRPSRMLPGSTPEAGSQPASLSSETASASLCLQRFAATVGSAGASASSA